MKKIKVSKSDKIFITIICIVFFSLLSAYCIDFVYHNDNGEIKTEGIYHVETQDIIKTQGFVVRDEFRASGDDNALVLKKEDGLYYYPIIQDSTSIEIGGLVALTFSTQEEVQIYDEIVKLEKSIEYFKSLQEKTTKNYLTMDNVEKTLSLDILNFIDKIQSNNIQGVEDSSRNLNLSLVSKKVLQNEKFDFTNEINLLEKEKAQLAIGITSKKEVYAPSPGYFVSNTDGFEQTVDYLSVANNEINTGEIADLFQTEPAIQQDIFGKIIPNHEWYLICQVEGSQAQKLKNKMSINNAKVMVSFEDKYLDNIEMTIQNVTDIDGKSGSAMVILKSSFLNEDLAILRNEKVSITLSKYEGYRINEKAINVNSEGLKGVYVYNNNMLVFKPITVVYYSEDYVIAKEYEDLSVTDNSSEEDEDNEQKDEIPILQEFDKVVVEGRNLEDGKIID